MIKLDIEDVTVAADLAVQGVIEGEMSASDDDEIYIEQVGGTRDYEKLENLPKLDGQTIIGNMQEKDPTVQAISLEELAGLFN